MESGGTAYLKTTNDYGEGRGVKTFFLLKVYENLYSWVLVALVKAMNEVMSLTDALETCGWYLVDY